jgi:hypothetical protein
MNIKQNSFLQLFSTQEMKLMIVHETTNDERPYPQDIKIRRDKARHMRETTQPA